MSRLWFLLLELLPRFVYNIQVLVFGCPVRLSSYSLGQFDDELLIQAPHGLSKVLQAHNHPRIITPPWMSEG